jgi:hypothetical protein
MSSQRRIEASRANGRKSRGPVTPEGKRRSSRNSWTHGMAAEKNFGYSTEVPAEMDALRRLYIDWLRPQNPAEAHIVQQIAAAEWRETRAWAVEAAGHDIRVSRQFKSATGEFPSIDPVGRTALAFMADTPRAAAAKDAPNHQDVPSHPDNQFFALMLRYRRDAQRCFRSAFDHFAFLRRNADLFPESMELETEENQRLANDPEPCQNEPNPNIEHFPNPHPPAAVPASTPAPQTVANTEPPAETNPSPSTADPTPTPGEAGQTASPGSPPPSAPHADSTSAPKSHTTAPAASIADSRSTPSTDPPPTSGEANPANKPQSTPEPAKIAPRFTLTIPAHLLDIFYPEPIPPHKPRSAT